MLQIKRKIWIAASGIWILIVVLAASGALGREISAGDTLLVRVKVVDAAWAKSAPIQAHVVVDSSLVRMAIGQIEEKERRRGALRLVVGALVFAGGVVGWAYLVSYSLEH